MANKMKSQNARQVIWLLVKTDRLGWHNSQNHQRSVRLRGLFVFWKVYNIEILTDQDFIQIQVCA